MMKSPPQSDIYSRSQDYALRAIQLCQFLRKRADSVNDVLSRQFLRAATSIGANLVEARSAESRKDFIHKCAIAQKEARETLYWLTLMSRAQLVPPPRLAPLIAETDELTAIITRILTTTKHNDQYQT